ncbi:hypothetical protein OG473_39430 (plasmid) [Streptomyces anulatus]|uniref:hypothetical protein n=1 Tax=Streptomyces anulatus TaxID=1892 RepID=UPI0032493170
MADITPADPKQPAYDAVFAYIRSQPDVLPATVVERNAMIWRAVHAALDAAPAAPAVAERLALVEALVSDFIDPDPCWFDHHGYCQAHGWAATDPGCPHGRAKALGLEETEEGNS